MVTKAHPRHRLARWLLTALVIWLALLAAGPLWTWMVTGPLGLWFGVLAISGLILYAIHTAL